MDEITMRMAAKLMGLEVMSFCVDYKTIDGQDRHSAVQVVGARRRTAMAAKGIYHELLGRGCDPQAIMHYPGDYTMDELEAAVEEHPPRHQYTPMFISEAAIREAQAACGR